MLIQLDIENIAVIEAASIEFGNGFNVITGETGAGKSLLINSVNMVLGCRMSHDLIREGALFARVCATFCCNEITPFLNDMGIECEDGSVVITRKLFSDGRNVCHINGSAVNVTQLRSVGEKLVVIHGQRDSGVLMNSSGHTDFIDGFFDSEELVKQYKSLYGEYKAYLSELQKMTSDEKARINEIDYLTYQLKEITEASLSEGEEEELVARRNILENSEAISRHSSFAANALTGDKGARDILYNAMHELEKLSGIDSECESFYERAASIYYEAEELGRDISRYSINTEFNPSELKNIEDRLSEINSLKRKYNKSVEEIIQFADEAAKRLEFLNSYSENKMFLEERTKELYEKSEKSAQKLAQARRESALRLCTKITEELSELDMPKCRVEFLFTPCSLSENGIETAELMLSTNPSEPVRPLSKIASGGEMSRIMLAMKSVFFDFDSTPTMLFDEIDTGVSGRAAEKIARKMRKLSSQCQIISVTHLPIMAAAGSHHILIEKKTDSESFTTKIRLLNEKERENEIARIISGDSVSEISLENARQLLNSI